MQFSCNDLVYGEYQTDEPVLVELINSSQIQRLKGISQYGIPDKYHHKKSFTRFDHSLGAMILLSRLGASKKEQVAGLLHDMSHTAFSHVIDYTLGNSKKEDYADSIFLKFLESPEISSILETYGYCPKDFQDLEKFGLLERHLPDLCADRLDYSLREIAFDGEKETAKRLFQSLVVTGNQIHFDSYSSAVEFAERYNEININHWAGFQAVNRYAVLGDVLRESMKSGEVLFNDLFKTDDFVIEKLEQSVNPKIVEGLSTLLKGDFGEGRKVETKQRFVDPTFIENNSIFRVSEKNPEFKSFLSKK